MENNGLLFLKTIAFVLEQIVITCLGISDQFSLTVQELMLKNDTLKNGTFRIGLYGSAPPGIETLKILYFSLFYSFVTYGIAVWGLTHKSLLDPIIVSQKKIIKIICFREPTDHAEPLFKNSTC